MTENDKRDLVLIGASLLGIAVGGILDDLHRGDKQQGASRAESDGDGIDEVLGAAATVEGRSAAATVPLISAPALITATQLSRRVGEQAGLPAGRLWSQALLAFSVSAVLTYFSDSIRRFAPGLGRS